VDEFFMHAMHRTALRYIKPAGSMAQMADMSVDLNQGPC
jgi:hypothetical protein